MDCFPVLNEVITPIKPIVSTDDVYPLGTKDTISYIQVCIEAGLVNFKVHDNTIPLFENLKYSAKQMLELQNVEIVESKCRWDRIFWRLSKNRITDKKVDPRIVFRYHNNNFLVKQFFTFGQRMVAEGTVHVYQVTNAPLLLYYLRPEKLIDGTRLCLGERTFHVVDQPEYTRVILQPNCNYVLPAHTIYILVSACKTLFSVHVVPEKASLPIPCENPIVVTVMDETLNDKLLRVKSILQQNYALPPMPSELDILMDELTDLVNPSPLAETFLNDRWDSLYEPVTPPPPPQHEQESSRVYPPIPHKYPQVYGDPRDFIPSPHILYDMPPQEYPMDLSLPKTLVTPIDLTMPHIS